MDGSFFAIVIALILCVLSYAFPWGKHLSDTRWACRHVACRNVMDWLPAIVQLLEEISSENHPHRAVEARGILVQIDLNFVGCLVLFRKVLSDYIFVRHAPV